MKSDEYISKVQERFNCKAESIQIEDFEALLIKDKYEIPYLFNLMGAKHYIYLHAPKENGRISLKYVKRYCDVTQVYTEQFFPTNRFFRMWTASTVPIITSESGFSDIAELYVRTTKFAKYGKICIPILVDLEQESIITLERFGLFGAPQFIDLTNYFKKQLCLEDKLAGQ